MANSVATILSYGMGVESSAILLRWVMSPVTRPCSLEDLIVITSQVGDEYTDTGRDVEAHILPLMRAEGIRYVQVARHGHFEADGITVLDDSRTPARVFLEGDYKLSDELKRNGTVPQYGGVSPLRAEVQGLGDRTVARRKRAWPCPLCDRIQRRRNRAGRQERVRIRRTNSVRFQRR
jgi:hypothetical protein